MLVRVPFADGWLYLNDTDQYAELGATPHEGAPGLVAHTGTIETIRPPAGRESGTETAYGIRVESDGAATLDVTRRYRGPAHGHRARMYADLSPEERHRHHQELVAEISQDAVADGELATDFETYPGTESFRVRIPRYGVRDEPFFYLTLPPLDAGLPRVRADARRTPLYWDAVARTATEITLALPAEYATPVLTPAPSRGIRPAGARRSGPKAMPERCACGAPPTGGRPYSKPRNIRNCWKPTGN